MFDSASHLKLPSHRNCGRVDASHHCVPLSNFLLKTQLRPTLEAHFGVRRERLLGSCLLLCARRSGHSDDQESDDRTARAREPATATSGSSCVCPRKQYRPQELVSTNDMGPPTYEAHIMMMVETMFKGATARVTVTSWRWRRRHVPLRGRRRTFTSVAANRRRRLHALNLQGAESCRPAALHNRTADPLHDRRVPHIFQVLLRKGKARVPGGPIPWAYASRRALPLYPPCLTKLNGTLMVDPVAPGASNFARRAAEAMQLATPAERPLLLTTLAGVNLAVRGHLDQNHDLSGCVIGLQAFLIAAFRAG